MEDLAEHQPINKHQNHGDQGLVPADAVSCLHSEEIEQVPADVPESAAAQLTGTAPIVLVILALACVIRQTKRLVPFASTFAALTFPPTKCAIFQSCLILFWLHVSRAIHAETCKSCQSIESTPSVLGAGK